MKQKHIKKEAFWKSKIFKQPENITRRQILELNIDEIKKEYSEMM